MLLRHVSQETTRQLQFIQVMSASHNWRLELVRKTSHVSFFCTRPADNFHQRTRLRSCGLMRKQTSTHWPPHCDSSASVTMIRNPLMTRCPATALHGWLDSTVAMFFSIGKSKDQQKVRVSLKQKARLHTSTCFPLIDVPNKSSWSRVSGGQFQAARASVLRSDTEFQRLWLCYWFRINDGPFSVWKTCSTFVICLLSGGVPLNKYQQNTHMKNSRCLWCLCIWPATAFGLLSVRNVLIDENELNWTITRSAICLQLLRDCLQLQWLYHIHFLPTCWG